MSNIRTNPSLPRGTSTGNSNPYSYTVSIGVIIPVVISIFLIVVICLLIIFIRRCRALSEQTRRGRQQPISSVSGNVASNTRRNRHGRNRNQIRMNVTIQQDSPPSYDEVIHTTPIGYLNMAFMWSQPDVNQPRVISPPSYEEATSPRTELPLLTSPGVLDQSVDSTSSGESNSRVVATHDSDTSSDGSRSDRHLHQRNYSSSSDSTIPERDIYLSGSVLDPPPPSSGNHSRQLNHAHSTERLHRPEVIETGRSTPQPTANSSTAERTPPMEPSVATSCSTTTGQPTESRDRPNRNRRKQSPRQQEDPEDEGATGSANRRPAEARTNGSSPRDRLHQRMEQRGAYFSLNTDGGETDIFV